MARLEIEMPQKFVFRAELPVRVSDLNYGGHVGNDAILRLMQEARVLFYRSLGIRDETTLDGRIGQIIIDSAVIYKSESFLGDILTFDLGISDFSKYGFDMFYLILNKETSKEVARGKTGILCFDYERRKVVSVPQTFLDKLNDK